MAQKNQTVTRYRNYLRSEHWLLLRGAKLQVSPRCEKCGGKEEMEVHHKVYRASWYDAKLVDLQSLCHGCHIMEHAKEWERLPQPEPAPDPLPQLPRHRVKTGPRPFAPTKKADKIARIRATRAAKKGTVFSAQGQSHSFATPR